MARWSVVAPVAADLVEGAAVYYTRSWQAMRRPAADGVRERAQQDGRSADVAIGLSKLVRSAPDPRARALDGWGIDAAKLAPSSSRGRRAAVDPATVADLHRAGKRPTQIARQLDVPAGTVRSVLSRAGLKSTADV